MIGIQLIANDCEMQNYERPCRMHDFRQIGLRVRSILEAS
jgi:hypothetical protein